MFVVLVRVIVVVGSVPVVAVVVAVVMAIVVGRVVPRTAVTIVVVG